MSDFAYGCCVGSWERFNRYVEPYTRGRLTVATSGQTSIALAYNEILSAIRNHVGILQTRVNLAGLILVHDDLEITDPHAEEKFREVLTDPDVALAGVTGGGGDTIAWWAHAPVGHQLTDVMNIDFGQHTGEVEYLDGSIMVLSPWVLQNLRFDVRFTGFHGYEEICTQARAAGKKVVVADVDTHHHTQMGFKSEESAAAWDMAGRIYRDKWRRG